MYFCARDQHNHVTLYLSYKIPFQAFKQLEIIIHHASSSFPSLHTAGPILPSKGTASSEKTPLEYFGNSLLPNTSSFYTRTHNNLLKTESSFAAVFEITLMHCVTILVWVSTLTALCHPILESFC